MDESDEDSNEEESMNDEDWVGPRTRSKTERSLLKLLVGKNLLDKLKQLMKEVKDLTGLLNVRF